MALLPSPMHERYLASDCSVGPLRHRRAGCLHKQVVIVQERPGALHSASVEVIMESADMGVPESRAVLVAGGLAVLVEKALLIVADIERLEALMVGGRGPGSGRRCGTLLGAVVLDHEVLDAVDGGVVGQVAPARASRLAGAVGVGAEGIAVRRVPVGAAQVEGGSHVL